MYSVKCCTRDYHDDGKIHKKKFVLSDCVSEFCTIAERQKKHQPKLGHIARCRGPCRAPPAIIILLLCARAVHNSIQFVSEIVTAADRRSNVLIRRIKII